MSVKMRPQRRSSKISIFKEVDQTPEKYVSALCPTNLQQQKELFLKFGIPPTFKMKGSQKEVEKLVSKKRGQISFDLLNEAKHILEEVKKKYGDGNKYMEAAYGPYTDFISATETLALYLVDCNCEGEITIYWTNTLECSAKMMWHGPNLRYNKPEARKYTMLIKNSTENSLLREHGVACLADHEIGTHYMRMVNDGLQPWFSDRKKFGLRPLSSREQCATEEGLATINTQINAQHKYLWKAAMTYYTACMATEMSFKELYNHLEVYMSDKEQRWKQVMRVKRGLADVNEPGGSGYDQVYFEGAVDVIRNIDKIDFHLLYSGKVCVDELPRVRRLARLDCLKTPRFLRDIERYKKRIRSIGYVNGLLPRPEKKYEKSLNTQKSLSKNPAAVPQTGTVMPYSKGRGRGSLTCGSRSITPLSSDTSSPTPSFKSLPTLTKINENSSGTWSKSSAKGQLSDDSCSDDDDDDDDDDVENSFVVSGSRSKSMTSSSGHRLLHRPQHEKHKLKRRHSYSRSKSRSYKHKTRNRAR